MEEKKKKLVPDLEPDPRLRQSGQRTRHRMPEDASLATATSQMRRRFEIDVDREAEDSALRSGIPTPLPRLALSGVPHRMIDDHALRSLPLDHRAGFVLAHIDGETTIRTLLDVCNMSHEEVAEVIERLVALRVIVLL